MKSSLLFAAIVSAGAFVLGAADCRSAEPAPTFRTGVVVTPKNFPDHTANDVADMFRLNAELGNFSVIRVPWSDPNRMNAIRLMIDLANQYKLAPVVELSPFKADELKGATLDPPRTVTGAGGRVSFTNSAVAEPFIDMALEVAELRPPYLALATDLNLLHQSDPGEYDAFAAVYRKIYERIKKISPSTKVFVTFQWDAMQQRDAKANREVIDKLRSHMDLLAFSSDPVRLFERQGPSAIAPDYYGRIAAYRTGREEVFVELNWPSDGGSGEANQVTFIRNLPRMMTELKPAMVAWNFLHDVKVFVFTARMGLINANGKQKAAFDAFRDLGGEKPSGAIAAASGPSTLRVKQTPDRFAIYTARLDGSDLKILFSRPDREMTHARVSPDGTRVVITGYNKRDKEGFASEDAGYENTEIMVLNLDGTGLETIIPPKPGILAANGDWTPDGKSLFWVSTDNPQRSPEIRQIDLATRKITRLPTPPGLKASDPHRIGNQMVFPVKADKGADPLWLMNVDGSGARQITHPPRSSSSDGLYGDFDPKLSPDGTKVTFMRIDGGTTWRVMVLDLKSGEERLLSPSNVMQWLPTWSGDGNLLLYTHIDVRNLKDTGLYTMTPDGKDRKKVPLPPGYFFNHGTIFPTDKSSPTARIIFSGSKKSWL
jgi:hypothetical protein